MQRAVAVTEHKRAFFEEKRLRAVALGGDGRGRRLSGQAAANDEDVGLLVPIDFPDGLGEVVLVLRLALRSTYPERAGRHTCEHRSACRLDEAAARPRQVETLGQIHAGPFPIPLPGPSALALPE